ncbi:membrane-targeted effector domain-containing toxin [Pseudomonas paralactis]|uniref:Membrane-targeted effector domain-containing toxin n=1 Tax=Pseudomonas paralactis TaxID=1615673 RepID=A0ABS0UYM3_9PSED|nr:membrane-targeted effector domain-containing toxin [Pseudomonas paralactis]MBI6633144.1 membrane-targeted effector domain-containing toxin [Pseudomonas paralactis]
MRYPKLEKHFKPSKQLAYTVEHGLLTQDMQRLHNQQPSFKTFIQAQLEHAFPDVRPLNAETMSVNRYRVDGDRESLASSEPLMTALAKTVQDILANPNKLMRPERDIKVEFTHRTSLADLAMPAATAGTLHSIARSIATQYPQAIEQYWNTPSPVHEDPRKHESPLNQLLTLHKRQLSSLAALRFSDQTLSAESKALIDDALRYPTLDAREKKFAHGDRLGVYPITIDDQTERGAMLAGAFLITKSDGSHATSPTWPNGRALELNDTNGPVVLYTPGEGFEEFATPAQARQALADRLDQGGTQAELLLQTLAPSLQNRADGFSGDDLMRSVLPSSGDVLAEAVPWMLRRQQAEISAGLGKALAPGNTLNPLLDSTSLQAIDNAADWSYLLDGSNAMLARDAKLADKNQPEWLKNLTPVQETVFSHLERVQDKSLDTLAPLLEKIPSLGAFSRDRLNAAINQQYPNAKVDADQLKVQVHTRTGIHGGRGTGEPLYSKQDSVSLTDLALNNPSGFPAIERGKFSDIKMTLRLLDTQGEPVLDLAGKPVTLDTDDLKKLVNDTDVGGEYTKLLKREMATDTESGSAAQLRTAWKASLEGAMFKEAFLAELNPDAYKEQAHENTTTKRAAQWVDAVMEHPDPATRPQVDGKNIIANSLVHRGLAVQGVMVIGNQTDSSLVLYTPKAPDGITFREVADHNALDTLLAKGEWASYIAKRKSPVSKDDIAQFMDALKSTAYNPSNLISPELIISSVKLLGSAISLKAIDGDVQDHLYKQHVQMVIDRADHQSVSSAEVAKQSTLNKIEFGIEVALIFADLIPVVGKGVSTGVRLGKAGVTALRANSRILPHLIKKPGLARAIYSDFTLAASGITNLRAAPMRPVLRSTGLSGPLAPRSGPRALPSPPTPPLAGASTSSGISTIATRPSTTAALPNRDLSAYTVPNEVISEQRLRPDGTYNVGDNWYVRYTDSTGTNRVYQIDSVFHARNGQVNIIDPNAPPTAPRGSRIVASLQSAGNGEWRLNEMAGGSRHRGRPALPADTYVDRILRGDAAHDITGDPAITGHIRRWFRRDVTDYYNNLSTNGLPARPSMPTMTINSTPDLALQSALSQPGVRGLVFGEVHYEPATYQMLIDQMQTFASSGVTTFYVEGAPFLQGSPRVGDGALTAADADNMTIRAYSSDYIGGPTMLDVVQEAEKHGIKVVGLEHNELTWRHDNYANRVRNAGFLDDRLREFNYYAGQIIQRTPPTEKYVAIVGSLHMNTYSEIPGLAELTGGIGVSVSPALKGSSSIVSQPPHTPPPTLKFMHGGSVPQPVGDIHIDYNIDSLIA